MCHSGILKYSLLYKAHTYIYILISCHYLAYINVFMLLLFPVFKFVSAGLMLVHFTLVKVTRMPVKYAL